MAKISKIVAREILDSRGNPSIEVDIVNDKGHRARAAVPSGASTGSHEAWELRDGDTARYLGKGVTKAIANVEHKIAPLLLGQSAQNFRELDQQIRAADATENKSNFGANAILGTSLALAKLAALESGLELFQWLNPKAYRLPTPLMNILNGGAHANNGLDVQEFMIVPIRPGSFAEALRCGAEVFQHLKKILAAQNLSTAVGDEGGFAPVLKDNAQALELIAQAVERAGYRLGEDVVLALDVAATELLSSEGKYRWENELLSAGELGDVYMSWAKKYPLISIEDAFAEDDWSAWSNFTAQNSKGLQLVGDDLFVTNPRRIQQGMEQASANALLVKVNQIGSLSETMAAIDMCHRVGWNTVMSHRSGETEDPCIADLAVGLETSQIKTGSLCRGERTAKYNQLLRIEEILGSKAEYTAGSCFKS